MKPLFSIVLIVKNGERTIQRLLDSLKDFKDRGGEICIMDTGSTDNTVSVCEEYGCKVMKVGDYFIEPVSNVDAVNNFFIEGEDLPILKEGDKYFNFGEARNTAHRMALNEMILSLDADEVITKMDIEVINAYIINDFDRFKHIQIFTHNPDGTPEVKFVQSKFYNRNKFRWQNIVHEMLVGNGKVADLDEEALTIEHFQDHSSDRSGYLRGLAVDCYLNQNKDRNSQYLAREFVYSGRYKTAEKEIKRHLAMELPLKEYDTTPTHVDSLLLLGQVYAMEGRIDEELECYNKAFMKEVDNRAVVVRLANFYKWHNQRDEVRRLLDMALTYPYDVKYGISEEGFKRELDEFNNWLENK